MDLDDRIGHLLVGSLNSDGSDASTLCKKTSLCGAIMEPEIFSMR